MTGLKSPSDQLVFSGQITATYRRDALFTGCSSELYAFVAAGKDPVQWYLPLSRSFQAFTGRIEPGAERVRLNG